MGAQVSYLADGRLHLNHGPIDLVIGATGAREVAFDAAIARFETVLDELVAELPALRVLNGETLRGLIAQRMAKAVLPHSETVFITPMAAVAGAVADEVLGVMKNAGPLRRAYVNNGGDIALWLAPKARFEIAVASAENASYGKVSIGAGDGIGGIATSGRGGRSLSRGIADSVTVLAKTAAEADAAATLIANAVDLPDHPAIERAPASHLDPDSDLGARLVTTGCARLNGQDCAMALKEGVTIAQGMIARGVIHSAALFLQGHARIAGHFPADQLPVNELPANQFTEEPFAHA